MKPWFTRKPACSVLEFNCCRWQTTSTDDMLERLDTASHNVLIVTHCPTLAITR
ncbi:TPA: hypothetical protein N0F65_013011 [Lagenidium giganteum]|uniref:Uncharacterized protein n=1 Tax=Lagenidium giganteum TaxID=4803 RepID=A0AAV2YQD0_9STRA|nr:TPA: hypothetical protein N0F65_013011 [Lagenidium giganteum]